MTKEYDLYLKAVRGYRKEIAEAKKKLKKTEDMAKSDYYNQRRFYQDMASTLRREIKWHQDAIDRWMKKLRRMKKIMSETKGQKIGRRVLTKSAMELNRKRSNLK